MKEIVDFLKRTKPNYLKYRKNKLNSKEYKTVRECVLFVENVLAIPIVLGILGYISTLTIPNVYQMLKNATNRVWFWNMKRKYKSLLNDYNRMKEKGFASKEEENNLISRAVQLKINIDAFKNKASEFSNGYDSGEIEIPTNDVYSTDEESDQFNEPIQISTPPQSYTNSIGDITTRIDAEALAKFQEIWKGKCSDFAGSELQSCKITAANRAISHINTNMFQCDNTDDSEGCKNTLRNLINYWNERKSSYMRRKFR